MGHLKSVRGINPFSYLSMIFFSGTRRIQTECANVSWTIIYPFAFSFLPSIKHLPFLSLKANKRIKRKPGKPPKYSSSKT